MKTPFRKLLIRSLIEDAVIRCEKRYRHYESAFSRAVKQEAAELLKKLMAVQLRNRLRFQEVQKKGIPEKRGCREEAEHTIPLEPEAEHAEPDPWASPDVILESVLVTEKNTYCAYRRISENALLGPVKELYAYFAREELHHIRWLEKMKREKTP